MLIENNVFFFKNESEHVITLFLKSTQSTVLFLKLEKEI